MLKIHCLLGHPLLHCVLLLGTLHQLHIFPSQWGNVSMWTEGMSSAHTTLDLPLRSRPGGLENDFTVGR